MFFRGLVIAAAAVSTASAGSGLRGAAAVSGRAAKMECGDKVGLCGALALSSGLGSGNYKHATPAVHGLWPEVGSYGDSQCVKPSGSTADPVTVVECYKDAGTVNAQIVQFEAHEWDKHGQCAGAVDAVGFFTTVCALAEKPLSIMAESRSSGGALADMAKAVEAAGYEIFQQDAVNSQLLLSACASADKKWKLALVADFPATCGDWAPTPDVKPAGNATAGSCAPAVRGPACADDAACRAFAGCTRCAKSGFCTDLA